MTKSYEELTIADDFMFGKVMEDRELCREVLECLLGQPVGNLEEVETEREFRYFTDGKPVRLDVYTRDTRHVYDAEMQNLNRQRIENLELWSTKQPPGQRVVDKTAWAVEWLRQYAPELLKQTI